MCRKKSSTWGRELPLSVLRIKARVSRECCRIPFSLPKGQYQFWLSSQKTEINVFPQERSMLKSCAHMEKTVVPLREVGIEIEGLKPDSVYSFGHSSTYMGQDSRGLEVRREETLRYLKWSPVLKPLAG